MIVVYISPFLGMYKTLEFIPGHMLVRALWTQETFLAVV